MRFSAFSTVHKKLVMGFLSGSSSFNDCRIYINGMTAQLLRRSTLPSVPFRCPWTSSRTKPLTLHMHHHSHCCIVAWQLQCKMGKRQMDNQEKPQPCNFSHHCGKAQSESSALMPSQNCSLKIFLLQKYLLVSTTLKIRGFFRS